ncbi:MAG: hypothetical protein M0Q26_05990 [Chitinophagaceae bacterium]|nr:hypothetical protein [Chitinophagaceae bacterium]MDP1763434.1 hypothetical protein [Sediminibacterium sp.]
MKNLFALTLCFLLLSALNNTTKAQIATLLPTATTASAGGVSSTLTNADTAYANLSVDGTTQSITVYDTKVSGTVSGTWYFQGTVKTNKFENLDSLTRVDGNGQKTFVFPARKGYKSYRLIGYQSGSAVSTFEIYTLRRSD